MTGMKDKQSLCLPVAAEGALNAASRSWDEVARTMLLRWARASTAGMRDALETGGGDGDVRVVGNAQDGSFCRLEICADGACMRMGMCAQTDSANVARGICGRVRGNE
jgi:hypothetical protein